MDVYLSVSTAGIYEAVGWKTTGLNVYIYGYDNVSKHKIEQAQTHTVFSRNNTDAYDLKKIEPGLQYWLQ